MTLWIIYYYFFFGPLLKDMTTAEWEQHSRAARLEMFNRLSIKIRPISYCYAWLVFIYLLLYSDGFVNGCTRIHTNYEMYSRFLLLQVHVHFHKK